jgi:hypothetical protein
MPQEYIINSIIIKYTVMNQLDIFSEQPANPVMPANQIEVDTDVKLRDLINQHGILMHEDAGHGWLQVSHNLVNQLGIAEKVSGCSYRDTRFAYLEEDCDLALLVNALLEKMPGYHPIQRGMQQTFYRRFFSMVENKYQNHSSIRNKARYKQ